jgi:chromosome segregation ATPase
MFLLWVMGCAYLSFQNPFENQNPLEASGTEPGTSHSKTAKAIAVKNQIKRKPVNLKQAKADLKLARQKARLTELKMELSVLEMKLSDYHLKIAETMLRKAKIAQQCQRIEADHKAGRVEKAAAIDKIKALKTKSLGLDSENINVKSVIAKLDLDIQELKRKIDLHIQKKFHPRRRRPARTPGMHKNAMADHFP